MGYSPLGHKESDATGQLDMPEYRRVFFFFFSLTFSYLLITVEK